MELDYSTGQNEAAMGEFGWDFAFPQGQAASLIGAVGKHGVVGESENIRNRIEINWQGGLDRETIDTKQNEHKKPHPLE